MRHLLLQQWLRLLNFAAQLVQRAQQSRQHLTCDRSRSFSSRFLHYRRRLTCLVLTLTFIWAATALCSYVRRIDTLLSVSRWERAVIAFDHASKPVGCIAWRGTQQCSPYGLRMPAADTDCRSNVQFTSGYCECDNSAVVALVGCGMHSFTCFDRCRELGAHGLHFPKLMQCSSQQPQRSLGALPLANATNSTTFSSSSAPAGPVPAGPQPPSGQQSSQLLVLNSTTKRSLTGTDSATTAAATATATSAPAPPTSRDPSAASLDASLELWEALLAPVRAHDPKPAQLLPKRTEDDDWLREGGRMPPGLADSLRSSLAAYSEQLGQQDVPGATLPPASQRGRGIVMVSGGLRYMVSAWISIAMLRRAGSTLPVEMWFPILEYPTSAVVEALRRRGVSCRAFTVPDLDQAGYSLKVAAIMLSSFSELLFLDADNFPLRDPAPLFDSAEYQRTGATFWRDYWGPTAVPELAHILGVHRRDLPDSSFEAGQMLIDKRKHWRGLRVALYFNYYHNVWYNLFTDYMGWGDKETFYYAFLAAREPTYYVPVPTGSVGMMRPFCRKFKSRQLCREVFTGNSMLQFDGSGAPLFLHANLEKWSLQLPDSFPDYTRRWLVMQPGGAAFPEWSVREMGLDLELFAYEQARDFRCGPFFSEYYDVRLRHGDAPIKPLDGLHTLMPGIEFHQLYRLGHRGTYTNLFERSLLDNFLFALGLLSRTVLVHVKRALRRVWGGPRVVRLLFQLERRLRNTLLSYSM
ncbi:hypothetical protein Agub_g13500 [Astrephomene gubernaculifera]|uniref:Uncharacterized protein n=1 Tax=Astrephomene gubernaculifera TaxID=47775 RepID=A0AAD3DZW5_9CHLO|nr:hypothetical protein Agub_g13500 [Astrephomene gubernaculifera]